MEIQTKTTSYPLDCQKESDIKYTGECGAIETLWYY